MTYRLRVGFVVVKNCHFFESLIHSLLSFGVFLICEEVFLSQSPGSNKMGILLIIRPKVKHVDRLVGSPFTNVGFLKFGDQLFLPSLMGYFLQNDVVKYVLRNSKSILTWLPSNLWVVQLTCVYLLNFRVL